MDRSESFRKYSESFTLAAIEAGKSRDYVGQCLKYASHLFDSGQPIIYDRIHLSDLLGINLEFQKTLEFGSVKCYKIYEVAKRSGGTRRISEPLPTLKLIQKWVLNRILYQLEPHLAAKAYRKGYSIKSGATLHRNQKIVLNLDIEGFFDSLGPKKVFGVFAGIGYSKEVSLCLTNLCTLGNSLPQGAPTSGALANLILRDFDSAVFKFARDRKIRFSRYSDDLTLSGDLDVQECISFVSKELYKEGLKLNKGKIRVFRQGNRQSVTGLVVNKKVRYPRSVYQELRVAHYYIAKYGLAGHADRQGLELESYRQRLRGLASAVLAITPDEKTAKNLLALI